MKSPLKFGSAQEMQVGAGAWLKIFLKSLVCLLSKVEVHLTPIYKKEGDIQNHTNCCGNKLISHTMKLWERVIEHRLIHETTISESNLVKEC